MRYRILLIIVFCLIFASLASAQEPNTPCGDGMCDQAEQKDPDLCPQDCAGQSNSNTGQPARPPEVDPAEERAQLPAVTMFEKWVYIADAGDLQNFAQSVVPLHEGGYRVFWNDPLGITSATSPDGVTFTSDEGVRLANGSQGDLDCVVSHAWVVPVENGYRMYYQGDAICREGGDMSGLKPEFRILSAFSSDGLTFERETGVRIDIGESTGLSQAAHGRTIQLADGTFRMYFSANFIGKPGMADLLGASSPDGLTWTLDDNITLEHGHDPAVVQIGETIYIYTSYGGANLLTLASQDGYTFTPTAWVSFVDQTGADFGLFGDVDVILTGEGRLLMYGIGRPGKPIAVFEKVAE